MGTLTTVAARLSVYETGDGTDGTRRPQTWTRDDGRVARGGVPCTGEGAESGLGTDHPPTTFRATTKKGRGKTS